MFVVPVPCINLSSVANQTGFSKNGLKTVGIRSSHWPSKSKLRIESSFPLRIRTSLLNIRPYSASKDNHPADSSSGTVCKDGFDGSDFTHKLKDNWLQVLQVILEAVRALVCLICPVLLAVNCTMYVIAREEKVPGVSQIEWSAIRETFLKSANVMLVPSAVSFGLGRKFGLPLVPVLAGGFIGACILTYLAYRIVLDNPQKVLANFQELSWHSLITAGSRRQLDRPRISVKELPDGTWSITGVDIPVRFGHVSKLPLMLRDIESLMEHDSHFVVDKEPPYCRFSELKDSSAELTLGCRMEKMSKSMVLHKLRKKMDKYVSVIRKHGGVMVVVLQFKDDI